MSLGIQVVSRIDLSLVQFTKRMGHEILEHFLIYRFPGAGNRKDKAPAAVVVGLLAIF